jgi:hypothetical protein
MLNIIVTQLIVASFALFFALQFQPYSSTCCIFSFFGVPWCEETIRNGTPITSGTLCLIAEMFLLTSLLYSDATIPLSVVNLIILSMLSFVTSFR